MEIFFLLIYSCIESHTGLCARFLLLSNKQPRAQWLKTMPVSCVTVSGAQELHWVCVGLHHKVSPGKGGRWWMVPEGADRAAVQTWVSYPARTPQKHGRQTTPPDKEKTSKCTTGRPTSKEMLKGLFRQEGQRTGTQQERGERERISKRTSGSEKWPTWPSQYCGDIFKVPDGIETVLYREMKCMTALTVKSEEGKGSSSVRGLGVASELVRELVSTWISRSPLKG